MSKLNYLLSDLKLLCLQIHDKISVFKYTSSGLHPDLLLLLKLKNIIFNCI